MNTQQPYKQLEDIELVLLYKQTTDQNLLATLYSRYADLVFGVSLKHLKDPDAAADAGLDIYEELVHKVLKHEIGYFKGWLHTLTRNHCLMKLRSQKNKRTVDLPNHLMQTEDAMHLSAALEKEGQLSRLEACIEHLNSDQKKVVQLFYLEEKCYNDITSITGLEWNMVRSHIQNGRRNLKICMDQHAANE
ncbi:MAG: sigma-70 family RNA polymerase sigma factor [Chitinophagaceae bacterium]